MSGKLDQSLDAIMKDSKPAGGAGGRRGRGRLPGRKAAAKSKAATTATIAPVGGVQKKTKAAAKPVKTPSGPAASGDSKISVSGLPEDVTEALIKDYFTTSVAPVKKVILNYGPTGRSRGSATVTFSKPTAAADAAKLDGTSVDGRPMRIEVVMGAKSVPRPQPPKSLAERVASQPKNAAKQKTKEPAKGKATTNGAAKTAQDGKKKGKAGRGGRPKAKTADELDAEMQDYFGGGEANGATVNGTAPPVAATNGGDTGMDEVL